MKIARMGLPIIVAILAILAIGPSSTYLIRSEFERRTGSRIEMDRCQVNPWTGGVLIEQATISNREPSVSDRSDSGASIRIAKIWSRGSLKPLMYRKIAAPLTVMDGVAVWLSPAEQTYVPALSPITSIVSGQTPLLANRSNPAHLELQALHQAAQSSLGRDREVLQRIESDFKKLQQDSIHLDNPLRDQETILKCQQNLVSLQRELHEFGSTLNRNRDQTIQSTASRVVATPTEFSASAIIEQKLAEDASMIERQANYLFERCVCDCVEKLKPHLDVSASLTRHWLLDRFDKSTASPRHSEVNRIQDARGTNYQFGSMHQEEVMLSSIRMRGTATVGANEFPFIGRMKNVGSQRMNAEDRPSFNLTFTPHHEPSHDNLPSVAIQATIVPDRRGFRLQSQHFPTNDTIAMASQGDWKMATFGKNVVIHVGWMVHHAEWNLDLEIQADHAELVVDRGLVSNSKTGAASISDATLAAAPATTARIDPCFAADEAICLLKAKFHGTLVDGQPRQQGLQFESPAMAGMIESMMQQHKLAMELALVKECQDTDESFEQSLAEFQSQVEAAYDQLFNAQHQLMAETNLHQPVLAELTSDRTNVRFSRNALDRLQR